MKRFLTSDDYIVSLGQLLESNEFSQQEIDELHNMEVGEMTSYTLGNYVMRIPDGEHLSNHDDYETVHAFVIQLLNAKIDEAFISAHEKFKTTSGDIDPIQFRELDDLKSKLADLMAQQVLQNNPKITL